MAHGRRIDRNLGHPQVEQGLHVVQRADAPADRQRNGNARNGPPHGIEKRRSILQRGRDVQKRKLVRTGSAIGGAVLGRVTDVAEVDKIDPLDETAVFDIQTWNNRTVIHELDPPHAGRVTQRLHDQTARSVAPHQAAGFVRALLRTYPRTAAGALCGRRISGRQTVLGSALRGMPTLAELTLRVQAPTLRGARIPCLLPSERPSDRRRRSPVSPECPSWFAQAHAH